MGNHIIPNSALTESLHDTRYAKVLVTDASEAGLLPGCWPVCVEARHRIWQLTDSDEEEAVYESFHARGGWWIIRVFND